MDSFPCLVCKDLSFFHAGDLNSHGELEHGEPECKVCNRRFEGHNRLLSHMLTAKEHQALHNVRCMIPGCNPLECIGILLSNQGVTLSTLSSSNDIPEPTVTVTPSSKPREPYTPPHLRPKVQCTICNRMLSGQEGLAKHMETSFNHRTLHSVRCRLQDCDPKQCSGQGQIPGAAADSEKPSGEQAGTAVPSPGTGWNIIEPGPPDPNSPASSSNNAAQPGPASASASTTRMKKKKKAKKKTATANPSTSMGHILDPFSNVYNYVPAYGDKDYYPRFSYVDDYGSDGMRELTLCNDCGAWMPPGGEWDHSCPGSH